MRKSVRAAGLLAGLTAGVGLLAQPLASASSTVRAGKAVAVAKRSEASRWPTGSFPTDTFPDPARTGPVRIGVIGDSLSAEYYGDYDPDELLLSITESFAMGALASQTDCGGGNFGADIVSALFDGVLPLVPMITDLPARNWVDQLALYRSDDVSFGALTSDPGLHGEPRLRGHETNFARVSGTVLAPGLGGHDMRQQVDAMLPYVGAGELDVVFVMVGSNDFAARELRQQSFCDATWDQFQDELVGTMFGGIDDVLAAGAVDVLVGLLPLGTASGIAQGVVLQGIQDTNARIIAGAASRGLPTLDVWRFNQDPSRVDPVTEDVYIGQHVLAMGSTASIEDAVIMPTPGSGVVGACTTRGACGTLATTLNFISTDGLHPGTVPQGFIANEILGAIHQHFGYAIAPLSDREILEAGGTFVPKPGGVADIGRWVQIRQKGSGECLTIRGDDENMEVAACVAGAARQRWYVVPYDGHYMLRSAHTVGGHSEGTCIRDAGWRFALGNCADDAASRFEIYGGDLDRDWFVESTLRDTCIYSHPWFEGGAAYGTAGNCGLSWGWDYMRWGFSLNGGSEERLDTVTQPISSRAPFEPPAPAGAGLSAR